MSVKYYCAFLLLNIITSFTVIGAPEKSPKRKTIEATTEEFSIIGGGAADIKDVPYQVFIAGFGSCGGSIVAANIILTAGHCVDENKPDSFLVRAGSSLESEGGVVRKVARIRVHPHYEQIQNDYAINDVALMWLDTKLEYTDKIQPVNMAAAGAELPTGTELLASGWGVTETGFAESLQKVIVPTISSETCQQYYPKANITETMMCAGHEQGGKGVCFGDSGGPLVYNGVQHGIVSWGDLPCAGPRLPGVYAKVAALRDWIDQAMSGGI